MRVDAPEREAGGERHVADLPLELDVEGEERATQVVDALFSRLVSLAGDAAGDGQMILAVVIGIVIGAAVVSLPSRLEEDHRRFETLRKARRLKAAVRNTWRRIRAWRWTSSELEMAAKLKAAEREMAMKLKVAEVELQARENYLVRLAEEDAGKFGAMEKRLDERELRLEKMERDWSLRYHAPSSLVCDGCDVRFRGGDVVVRLVNTDVDYCAECMQVGCIAVDPSVSEMSAEDREEYCLAVPFMIGKALRAAHAMRVRQLDLDAGGKVPLFRPGMAQPPEEDMEEEALATIPEEEIEATDIGPPDDPNTSKRSSSRPPDSQQPGGQVHDGGPQAGDRGNQQSGGRVHDGGPRSGGQAKRQKKLAKKARQKAKQRRADWSKPGQGLVEEAEASD